MNHMTEVAKMFGVELNKIFKCSNGYTYKFTDNGLLFASDQYGLEGSYDQIFMALLIGTISIDEILEV